MKIITDPENIKIRNSIVTLGKFDGNHIGHQRLFEIAIQNRTPERPVVVFTFREPPAKLLHPEEGSMHSIQTRMERQPIDFPDGVDYVVEYPFTEETRSMMPETFAERVLAGQLDAKLVVVGVDFCFGKNRSGNVETLKALGERFGFSVIAVEKVKYCLKGSAEPQEVSSTLIKQEIRKGNLSDVRAMLGRPFFVSGEVLNGKHLGRTIGFPTLNLRAPEDKVLPPNGVYATCVFLDGACLPSVTNVGVRPTFDDGEHHTIETYILDFQGDLYGRTVRVDFYEWIRPEQKFAGIEELKMAIEADLQAVRAWFDAHPVREGE